MKVCPRCAQVYPEESASCRRDGTTLQAEVDELTGKTVAHRYRLVERLAAGPKTLVYLARHVMIDRLSALELLRPAFSADPASRQRFLARARAVNRIQHEHLVNVSDYGDSDVGVYVVMEYVAGATLANELARAPFVWQRAASIAGQLASALGRAHLMGLVHGCLEPKRVLLVQRRDGTEGAKMAGVGAAPDAVGHTEPSDAWPYLAPECLRSETRDVRSDLYALGAVLYEALAGAALTRGDDGEPLAVEALVGVPEALSELVAQLLRADPEQRPRDAFVVQAELAAALRGAARFSTRPPLPSDAQPVVGPLGRSPRAPELRSVGPASRLADVEPTCRKALMAIERSVAEVNALPAAAQSALTEARALLDRMDAAGEAVRRDQREISAIEQEAAEVKASFGRALDEVGRDASRARAALDELSRLRADLQRQAAVGEHLRRERSSADDLDAQAAELRRRLDLQLDEHDERLAAARATLDDHVAALRELAAETWSTLQHGAALLGVPPSVLEVR